MKRTRLSFVIMIVMVLATATAMAQTYTVKSGDCLSKIAQSLHIKPWQELYKANQDKISNPDLIFPGQVLAIPAEGKAGVAEPATDSSSFIWKNAGVVPFGNRDFAKAIQLFGLPTEVQAMLIARVNSGQFEWYQIKSGDRFPQMVFGNYQVRQDVIVGWDLTKLERARLYQVEHQGWVYSLLEPLACHNWAWCKKAAPEPLAPPTPPIVETPPTPSPAPPVETPPEVVPPPPPIVETPPAPPVVETPLEPEKLLPLIPPPVEVPTMAKPKPHESFYENETYMWAGRYWSLEGHGVSNYIGGRHNSFFARQGTSAGRRIREGVGFTLNAWNGNSDGFLYHGDRWSAGPAVDWTTRRGDRYTVVAQFGKQRDFGKDGLGYVARQDTSVLALGLSTYNQGLGKIKRLEAWGDVNFDVGHSKYSNWENWPIPKTDDPATDKTYLGGGGRFYLYTGEKFNAGVLAKGTYALEDSALGKSVGAFLTDRRNIFKVGAEYRNISGSKYSTANGNAVGIGADIDLGRLFSRIKAYVRSHSKEKQ